MILTSWDDGHPLDLRVGEMLSKHGLTGTFFVPLENREGLPVMTALQMRELDQCHEIGSHTRTHCYLLRCSRSEARSEIETGKQQLEEMLGHRVDGFCYPGGEFDSDVTELVKAAGFSYARTVENLRTDVGHDPWQMPTTLQFYPHGTSTLINNALKHWAFSKLALIRPRIESPDFFAYARQIAACCVRSNTVFHLWGHSWEIEEQGLWNELDSFLGYLSIFSSSSAPLKTVCDVKPKPNF
ncbi:MAG: polysaccharide deacetylase family protein [Rhodoferax sp.]|nr:polysaccharide deacetylase family protein [Rhodoferax sp.]